MQNKKLFKLNWKHIYKNNFKKRSLKLYKVFFFLKESLVLRKFFFFTTKQLSFFLLSLKQVLKNFKKKNIKLKINFFILLRTTKKSKGVRMGKGKGKFFNNLIKLVPGFIFFKFFLNSIFFLFLFQKYIYLVYIFFYFFR